MCMMMKIPKAPAPMVPGQYSRWHPAHSINPNVPQDFWFWMVTYGTMGALAGLLLAFVVYA